MKTIVLDTNIFLRVLLKDNPLQVKEIEKVLQKGKKEEAILIIPQIVLFEVAFGLEKFYQLPKETVINNLNSIINIPYFEIQDKSIFIRAIEIFKKENISLADCFIASFAEKKQAELFTFDKKLQKISKEVSIES